MADTERSMSMSTTHNKPPPVPPARSDSLSVQPRREIASHDGHQPVPPARRTHGSQQLLPSAQDELRKKLLARSTSQVQAGEESTVDDLPPPPPELQSNPQELRAKDEDEFERLVQQQGLLGALGFSSGPQSPDTGRKTPPRRPLTPPQRSGSSTAVAPPHRPPPPHAQPAKPPRSRTAQRAASGDGGDQQQAAVETPKRQLLPQKKREPAPVPTPPSHHHRHHQPLRHTAATSAAQPTTASDAAVKTTPRPPRPARRPGDASKAPPPPPPPQPPEPPARAASKAAVAEAAATDISTRISHTARSGKPPRRLSFNDKAEVVDTYATDEYDRSNETLNVEAALEDSDRESPSARLRQQLEEDHDFVTATLVLGDDQGVGIGLRGLPIKHLEHTAPGGAPGKGAASTNPFASDSTSDLVSMVVSGLVEGGAAYDNGNVYVGDVLVSLDDEDLLATTHERAVNRLQACQGRVRVVLARKRGLKRAMPTARGAQAAGRGHRDDTQHSQQQQQQHGEQDTIAEQAGEIERLKGEVERVTSQLKVVQTAAANAGQALEQKEELNADLRQRLERTKQEAQRAQHEKEQVQQAADERLQAATAVTRRAEEAEAKLREATGEMEADQQETVKGTKVAQQENAQLTHQLEQEKARRQEMEKRVADLEKELAAATAGGSGEHLLTKPAATPAAGQTTAAASTTAGAATASSNATSASGGSPVPPRRHTHAVPPRPAHRPGSPASKTPGTAAAAAAAASRGPAPHPQPKPRPKPKVVPKPATEPKPPAHRPKDDAGLADKITVGSGGGGGQGGAPVPAVRPRPRPRARTAALASKPPRKASGDHGKAPPAAGSGGNVTDVFEAISDSAAGTLDVRAHRDRAMSASRAIVRRRLPTRSHRSPSSATPGRKPPVPRARAATAAASAASKSAYPLVPSRPHPRPAPAHRPPLKPAKAPGAVVHANSNANSNASGSIAESGRQDAEDGDGSGDGLATSPEPEVKRRNKRFSIGKSLRRLSRRLSSADLTDSSFKNSTPSSAVPGVETAVAENAGGVVESSGDAAAWDVDQVCAWLHQVQGGDFAKYAEAFRQQAIDGKRLLECGNTDALKGLGVKSIGHRTILKRLICDLHSS